MAYSTSLSQSPAECAIPSRPDGTLPGIQMRLDDVLQRAEAVTLRARDIRSRLLGDAPPAVPTGGRPMPGAVFANIEEQLRDIADVLGNGIADLEAVKGRFD